MYPCDGCHDVNTVCVLFLGDARDVYRGLPGLSRLSQVDHWMITRFSRGNLGGSLQYGQLSTILSSRSRARSAYILLGAPLRTPPVEKTKSE
jgi:hypothetical protein